MAPAPLFFACHTRKIIEKSTLPPILARFALDFGLSTMRKATLIAESAPPYVSQFC